MSNPVPLTPSKFRGYFLATALLFVSLSFAQAQPTAKSDQNSALDLNKILKKTIPESVEELRLIQANVQQLVKKVSAAVVGVRIGAGQGSGVIISEDGYVLTAAHVSGAPNRNVTLIMPDGRKVRGKTLGYNKRVDGGLIKIEEKGKWPHIEMGTSTDLKRGDWCVAIGHPGGYRTGRTPVVRLGRVLDNFQNLIRTDCTLVGGDSGGPLFDMTGKVIGIHSRIGPSISYNIHVPVDTYKQDWDRLVMGEELPSSTRPYLGVQGDPDSKVCKILMVYPDSPAAAAGLKENDVVLSFDGTKIGTFEDLVNQVSRRRPGQSVNLEVRRGDETITLNLKIGKREES